jgi:hypothetical protein
MDIILKKALHDLARLRDYDPNMEVDEFVDSFNIIFYSLPTLSAADLVDVLCETLPDLTDGNSEAHFIIGIPGSILAYVFEKKLLSVADITMTMTRLASHFITKATEWIGPVYKEQYLKYAYRYRYPIEEIEKGIRCTSVENISNLLRILQALHNPPRCTSLFGETAEIIIRRIEDQILPIV